MFDGADLSRRKQKEARRIFKHQMQMRDKDGAERERSIMSIDVPQEVKWLINKASGWSSVTYVETTTVISEDVKSKTETRKELIFLPKKARREWFGVFGEWLVKMMPYLTIIGISIASVLIIKYK